MKIYKLNEETWYKKTATYEIRRQNDDGIIINVNSTEKAIKIINMCKKRNIDFYILKYTAETITEEQLRMEGDTIKYNI
jgi:hypothetical protein